MILCAGKNEGNWTSKQYTESHYIMDKIEFFSEEIWTVVEGEIAITFMFCGDDNRKGETRDGNR